MPRSDWRSPAAYDDKRKLDAPGFAFEFLKRNRAFRRDYERLSAALAKNALTQAERDRFARRWGVRFREAHVRLRKSRDSLDGDDPADGDGDCADTSVDHPQ
jgi:hypothetical protein